MSSWDVIDRNKVEAAIYRYIMGRNAERNRQIVHDKMVSGLTFEKIAERHDMSVSQIKRIVYKFEYIYRHL